MQRSGAVLRLSVTAGSGVSDLKCRPAVLQPLLQLRSLPSNVAAEVQTLFRNCLCVDRLLGGAFKAADNHKAAPAKTLQMSRNRAP